MNIYTIIPCHVPRVPDLKECLSYLGADWNKVIVVSNGFEEIYDEDLDAVVVHDPGSINISRWWNKGIDTAYLMADRPPDAFLFLNSDCRIDWHGVEWMASILRDEDLGIVGPDVYNRSLPKETEVKPYSDLSQRIPGWCFMVPANKPVRPWIERRWWLSEIPLEMSGRLNGGSKIIPHTRVYHPPQGSPLTPQLDEWYAEDREKFKERYGWYPHD